MSFPLPVRVLLAALSVFSVANAVLAEPPDVRATSVTIPYAELRALWDAAHVKPAEKPPAPVPHAISLARFAFEFSPELASVACRASFEVTNFGEGWAMVPLLPSDVRIESVAPDAAALVLREGFYTLMINGTGKRIITIRFAARLPNVTGTAPGLRLAIPPALISEASFAGLPAGSAVELTDGVRVSGSGGTGTVFRLGAAPDLAFSIISTDRRSKKISIAASWSADVQTMVSAEEGRITCRARILANGVDGDTAEMRLLLPAMANIREVEGDNLERWESTRSDDGLQRVVVLRWSGSERFAREVKVTYELPITAREGEWILTAPAVKGAIAQRSVFFVVAKPGLEITAANAVDPVLSAGLDGPGAAMKTALDGASYSTIHVLPGETVAAVKVKRLPLVVTSPARIDDAYFQMRVVADGSLLTDAKFSVRHDRPQALRFEFPKGSELLSFSINGGEVNPIDCGGGVIEVMLPPVADGKSSRVAFSYAARAEKLGPVSGKVELMLPRTELFASTIGWEVHLPGAYELTAFEGNVELAPPGRAAADPTATVVRLRKDLCKGEAPRVALFYQKRAVNP